MGISATNFGGSRLYWFPPKKMIYFHILLIFLVGLYESRRPSGLKPGRRLSRNQGSEVICKGHAFMNRIIINQGAYILNTEIDGCGKAWWDLWQLLSNELLGAILMNNVHVTLSFQDDFHLIHKDEIESTIPFPLIYEEESPNRPHTQTKETAEAVFGSCVVTFNYDIRFVEFIFKTECYTAFNYHVWLKSIGEILRKSKRQISFKFRAEIFYTSDGVQRLFI